MEVLTRWEGKKEQRRIQWGLDDVNAEVYQLGAFDAIRNEHLGRLEGVTLAQTALDLPSSVFDSDRGRILDDWERELNNQRRLYEQDLDVLAKEREMLTRVDKEEMEAELRGVSEGMLAPFHRMHVRNAYLVYKHNPSLLRRYLLN
jgi:hypothetical protein